MAKSALITGITGQDGSYLAELLLEKGYEVHGLVRRSSTSNFSRIAHLCPDAGGPIQLHYGDLTDAASLFRILKNSRPDEVYNLAAQSHVGVSFQLPEHTGNVTGLGAARLMEAMHVLDLPAKFYQASSSELFGKVYETPQTEETPFHPRSPYACAKAYAYHMTRNYRESYGMYAVNGILFNHESPRRGTRFVTRKITHGLASVLAGQSSGFTLSNMDAQRDWGYAKEYVEGMWRMMQQDQPEDFILATGKVHSVRELLETALQHAGIPYERQGTGDDERFIDLRSGQTLVSIDARYKRPAEVDVLTGDATKAKEILGWEPQTSFSELVQLMVEADCELCGTAPLSLAVA